MTERFEFAKIAGNFSPSLGEEKANELIKEAIRSVKLPEKENYSPDEVLRICGFIKENKDGFIKTVAGYLTAKIICDTKDMRKINDLILDLHAANRKLEEWSKTLEDKILERTAQLTDTQVALRESVQKHKSLLAAMPQKVFYKNLDSAYVICNESFARDLGMAPEEIVGKTDFDFFPKKLAEKYIRNDKRIIVSQKTEELEEEYEKDGRQLTVQMIKAPIKNNEGEVVGVFGIFWDVTEKKIAQEKLRAAYEELKKTQDQLVQSAKMNAIGQLASSIAHEIKNPLGIVLQGVNYIETSPLAKRGSDIADMLNIMKNNIKRADDIVRTLLDFSKSTQLQVRAENINKILESSVSLIKHKTELTNIEIIKELAGNLPKISLDKTKTEQVFINIFMNSIQAMPDGGRLVVRSYKDVLKKPASDSRHGIQPGSEVVVVEIADSGCGISGEDLQHIFEPFFTTKSPRGGTGLGLTVTKNIIDMHKAFIRIDSRKKRGTRVSVIFQAEGLIDLLT